MAEAKRKVTQKTPRYGLCLDWETSGATWGGDSTIDHQGIQVGAIIFDTDTFTEVKSLKLYIKFDASRYKWTTEAEKIHGITREFLEEHGVTREEAVEQLGSMIFEYIGDTPIMFMGHNADFDIAFTNQLFRDFDITLNFHHVVIDTASAAFVAMKLFKSELIFNELGFVREAHDALEDARMTLATCQTIREVFNLGLATIA